VAGGQRGLAHTYIVNATVAAARRAGVRAYGEPAVAATALRADINVDGELYEVKTVLTPDFFSAARQRREEIAAKYAPLGADITPLIISAVGHVDADTARAINGMETSFRQFADDIPLRAELAKALVRAEYHTAQAVCQKTT
jgi:hypothetical protein